MRPSPRSPAGQPGGAVRAAADGGGWLVLTYQLPAKPAGLGAAIRGKLTAAGAVYLSRACAVAPLPGQAEIAMRRAQARITRAGGCAVLLAGQALAGEAEIIRAFNAIHDQEYDDIIAGCTDAVAEIGALAAAGDLGYQPLWASDILLRRLSARYRAVQGKDLFAAGKAQAAGSALVRYRLALDEHASRVYASDNRE